jgi:hypothetical protein
MVFQNLVTTVKDSQQDFVFVFLDCVGTDFSTLEKCGHDLKIATWFHEMMPKVHTVNIHSSQQEWVV